MLIKWLTRFPDYVDGVIAISETISSISLKHMSLWYPFLELHLTMHHSNIGIGLR